MADDYEYHKQNDYPGERTAEKKRVAERAEAADKRSDARVAEKGRTEGLKADNRVARQGRRKDKMLDSEIERSTARARRVKRSRNAADAIGLMIGVVVVAGLLVGLVWSYVTIRQQADEIDALNQQIVSANNVQAALSPTTSNLAPLSDANRQMQLYIDFLVLAADTKEEVNTLKQYNGSYSNMYQLCANFMEKENNINHAMGRFTEKEIVYYRQIAALMDKSQCTASIDELEKALAESKAADEELYVQNMNQCDRVMDIPAAESAKVKLGLEYALADATAKTEALTNAEKEVIACFA